MNGRAVSEVFGFVLIFALITSTVGVVYTSGVAELERARNAERLENMERAFDVLDDNIEDVYGRGAPSRATEIKLSGGTFRFSVQTELTVTVNGTSYRARIDPIEYAAHSGDRIAYVGGATIRSGGSSNASVMLDEPPMRFGSESTVIHLVESRSGGEASVSGSTPVLVRSERDVSQVLVVNTSSPDVTFAVNTTVTRAQSWKRYVESELPAGYVAIDDDPSDGRLEYEFETDRLVVSRTRLQIDFS